MDEIKNEIREYVKEYELSQYEDINLRLVSKEGVDARYIEQEQPAYKGNVLIEALPPRLEIKESHKALRRVPYYGEAERYKSNEYRIDAIMGLSKFIYVRMEMIKAAKNLDIILKRGYADKYINTAKYVQELNVSGAELRNSKKKEYQLKNSIIEKDIDSPMAPSMCIIGPSGEGKSTVANRILSRYPQVIKHTKGIDPYKEFHQIVWVKIECVANKRINGMILKFLDEIDDLVGTDFAIRYKRTNQEQLKKLMKQIIKYFGIGVLVIDEMQHIGKTVESEATFNALVSLTNEVNLPIVYIGTYQIRDTVFQQQFRHARRIEGISTIDLGLLVGEEFDLFLASIWKYQWTRTPVELTDEFKKVMYEKTLGITDYIVKLFMMAQIEAIFNGKEKLTPKLMAKIADSNFKMSKEQRDAYRSNDITKIKKCGDLIPIDISIFQEDKKARIQGIREFEEYRQSNQYFKEIEKEDAVMDVIVHFGKEGFEYNEIKNVAQEVIKKQGLLQRSDLFKKVGKLLRQKEE